MVRDAQAVRYIWDAIAALDVSLDRLFPEFLREPLGPEVTPSYAQRRSGLVFRAKGSPSGPTLKGASLSTSLIDTTVACIIVNIGILLHCVSNETGVNHHTTPVSRHDVGQKNNCNGLCDKYPTDKPSICLDK